MTEIDAQVLAVLQLYSDPGNVRELENIIERGAALATDDVLRPARLLDELRGMTAGSRTPASAPLPTLENQEADYIRWVLEQTQGNRTQAALILGIDRVSLWRKLKRYGIADGRSTE